MRIDVKIIISLAFFLLIKRNLLKAFINIKKLINNMFITLLTLKL